MLNNTTIAKYYFVSVLNSNRSQNSKNTLAVTNSITYDEVHKTEAKTVPHRATETGELYAMSTKAADKDTADKDVANEPPLLYTYARVDLDMKRVRYAVVVTNPNTSNLISEKIAI